MKVGRYFNQEKFLEDAAKQMNDMGAAYSAFKKTIVVSVNGQKGEVEINKNTLGLQFVNNSADIDKIVSNPQKLYIDQAINQAITNLIDGAPEALNSFLEISQEFQNEKSAITAINAAILNKEPMIEYGTSQQYLTGAKTWRNLYQDVRDTVLTGLDLTVSAAITATDTVKTALGKLQKQITVLFGKFDGFAATREYNRFGYVTLPAIAVGTPNLVDVTIPFNKTFPPLSGKTLADIEIFPTFFGLSTSLLGKITCTVKTRSLSGVTLTLTNTGLVTLAAGASLRVDAQLVGSPA